jgi:hypothetical protein
MGRGGAQRLVIRTQGGDTWPKPSGRARNIASSFRKQDMPARPEAMVVVVRVCRRCPAGHPSTHFSFLRLCMTCRRCCRSRPGW